LAVEEDSTAAEAPHLEEGGDSSMEDMLRRTADIVEDRDKVYGPPDRGFKNIAGLWAIILGHDVTLAQVALCMDAVRTARLIETPDHADSWVDKAGYSACGHAVTKSKKC